MTPEQRLLIYPLLGAALWWATGRGLFGTKAWRRILWPLAMAVATWSTGYAVSRALWVFMVGWWVHSGGYGGDVAAKFVNAGMIESYLWFLALSLGGWTLIAGAAWWWLFVIALWFRGMLWWSHKNNDVPHALTEEITGLLQGIAIALVP